MASTLETVTRERSMRPFFKALADKKISGQDVSAYRVQQGGVVNITHPNLGVLVVIESGEGVDVSVKSLAKYARFVGKGGFEMESDGGFHFQLEHEENVMLVNKRKRVEMDIRLSPSNPPPAEEAMVGARVKPVPPTLSAAAAKEIPRS